MNPDALKSWYMGMASNNIAADGYATMLQDAVDLVEAGHKIYIERHPEGLGDIVDVTERIAYQHKRVAGKSAGEHVKKAIKQLAGFDEVPGAPDGFRGVAQIDVRNNKNYARHTNEKFQTMMRELSLGDTSRLDEVQIVLDDRMLVFDDKGELRREVCYDDDNATAPAARDSS